MKLQRIEMFNEKKCLQQNAVSGIAFKRVEKEKNVDVTVVDTSRHFILLFKQNIKI